MTILTLPITKKLFYSVKIEDGFTLSYTRHYSKTPCNTLTNANGDKVSAWSSESKEGILKDLKACKATKASIKTVSGWLSDQKTIQDNKPKKSLEALFSSMHKG